jgi:thioredoxin reductase (NADPH)
MSEASVWETVIVGGGPAGLAAGMHLARAGYRVLLAERNRLGGQARSLGRIENYPGFPLGIGGHRLMDLWVEQARRWGLRTRRAEARQIRRSSRGFILRLDGGRTVRARTVIYCPGAAFRGLDLPGEMRLEGRGLFHAVPDSATLWRGRTVAVVGGGEAAAHQALALARQARRVYLVCRAESIKAHRLLRRRLKENPRIINILGAAVCRLMGQRRFESVELSGPSGRQRLEADALFALVGRAPAALPFRGGRLPPGFFVAGDAQGDVCRQVAVAAGSGIKAAMCCISFLEERA